MTERLEQHGINKTVNWTCLKETVLKHFPDLTEKKGVCDQVFIVCSKTARKIISDATQAPDEEAHTLLMVASVLRKAGSWHSIQIWWFISQWLRRIICSTTYEVSLSSSPRRTQIIARTRDFHGDPLCDSGGHAKYDFSFCKLELWASTCSEVDPTPTQIWSERVIRKSLPLKLALHRLLHIKQRMEI